MNKAYYHLPGLFEFYDLYSKFIPLFVNHREYFYDWCDIGSIYGAPADCLFNGGRYGFGLDNPIEVLQLMNKYHIPARLTFSNSLLEEKHLSDSKSNYLLKLFHNKNNGVIIYSDLLLNYIKENYPNYHFISSTTKVILDFDELVKELNRDEFKNIVIDFRLNKVFDKLNTLTPKQKDKIEFLCNECCDVSCTKRKACYKNVSLKNLDTDTVDSICQYNQDYRFSIAKNNPSFISIDDIQNIYLPNGFSNFKIEGRNLKSLVIVEFLLYYLTKPEYQLLVREELYLNE